MALSAAMDGGDPAVAALVVERGALEAWRAIVGGAVGRRAAERLRLVDLAELQRTADRAGDPVRRSRAIRSGRRGWTICRCGADPAAGWRAGGAVAARAGSTWLDWLRAVGGDRRQPGGDRVRHRDRGRSGRRSGGPGGHRGLRRGVRHRHRRASGCAGVPAAGRSAWWPTASMSAIRRRNAACSTRWPAIICWSPSCRPAPIPTRVRFLARNRLIAAMTQGTVVVEAALRSGARNTASWASECGGR